MENRVRVWLDADRARMHHAAVSQVGDMTTVEAHGTTDCGQTGVLRMVHHENVDAGKLCAGCVAQTGVRPPLAGQDLGPV